jgi:drug/metabolite transporter superfamily protein YnfA
VAACEIGGCFLVWQALRLNQPCAPIHRPFPRT